MADIEKTGVIFQDRKFLEKCWTHEIEVLVKAAGLERDRGLDISTNPDRDTNWQIAKDWSEAARYEQKTEAQARRLYQAVADPTNGVLPWIKNSW
ncbi:hypothetical protein BH23PLA1_BH23PLA1_23780 [soil metagenome]